MRDRSSNFDLMRLVAAFLVLWSHQFPLNGLAEPAIPWVETTGGLGVLIFFAISGYLNAQSLFRSKSVGVFLISRAARILPALFVCVIFCVVIGAGVTTLDLDRYLLPDKLQPLARDTPVSFVLHNSTLLFGLDYRLPGVFEANIYPGAVNGSLWTLPYEVKLYMLLALAGFCCRFRPALLAAIVVAGLLGFALLGLVRPSTALVTGKYATTFTLIFCAGVGLALIEAARGLPIAVAIFAALLAGFWLSGPTAAVLLGVMLICVLSDRIPLPRWMAPKRDISYGVYLYAFPIQQLTSQMFSSFWIQLILVVLLVTALATLSAILVEQPMLAWRKRLGRGRLATDAASPIPS